MTNDAPGLSPDDLNGHTLDELGDYLDRDRTPADPTIDGSAGCQLALDALTRLRELSGSMLDAEAAREPARDDDWIARILGFISLEVRAGRTIPYRASTPAAPLSITEGAVRGLVREAGDELGDLVLGHVALDGDVAMPDAPITIVIEASAYWGDSITHAIERARTLIYERLRLHTDLTIVSVDIRVHDIVDPPEGD